MEVSWNEATPKLSIFIDWIFHEKNLPMIGVTPLYKYIEVSTADPRKLREFVGATKKAAMVLMGTGMVLL